MKCDSIPDFTPEKKSLGNTEDIRKACVKFTCGQSDLPRLVSGESTFLKKE